MSEAAHEAATGVAPFDVGLDGLGHFSARGQPTVVWLRAGIGADDLLALGARVRAALRARRVPFDDKAFRPHVTLARVKRALDLAAVPELVAALAAVPPPSLRFRADALHVVESRLSPKGPRYSSIHVVRLARRADRLARPPAPGGGES